MRTLFLSSILVFACLRLGVSSGNTWAASPDDSPDIRMLKRAGLATEDEDLLRIVKNAARAAADLEQINALIKQLGDDDFDKREEASKRIITVGAAALPRLRVALKNANAEVARRAGECIDAIEKAKPGSPVAQAAARALVIRHPEGAGQALLEYLPVISGEPALAEEILFALDGLAERDARTRATLAAALKDASPVRRAGAACILARRGDKAEQEAVKKLLEDKEPLVRLRAAQGALAMLDKAAMPVLIALLESPEVEIAWQAEELLHWAAGEEAPETFVGSGSPNDSKVCREAWEAWLRGKGTKVDLAAAAAARRPGLMLLSVLDVNVKSELGRVYLCGCDGQPRWQLKDLKNVTDVRILPGGRILLAGWDGASERNLLGNVRWHYPGHWNRCELLPNGGVALIGKLQFTELAEDGLKSREHAFPSSGVSTPRIRADGLMVLVQDTYSGDKAGELVEVDPANGKAVNTFRLPATEEYGGSQMEPLSNGHALVSCARKDKVFELDSSGRIVWRAILDGPFDASRLPDGGTLVACGQRVVEIDSAGRVVFESIPAGMVERVRGILGAVRLGFSAPKPEAIEAELNRSRLRVLRSKDTVARLNALHVIKEVGPKARDLTPTLIELLSDPKTDIRWSAAGALGGIGPPAKEAIPALLRAMDGGDQPMWELHAPGALMHIGPSSIGPLIKAIKEDKSATVRAGAAHALAGFVDENPDCVAALVEAMRDDDPLVRRSVPWALHYIRPAPKEVLGALVQGLDDKDEKVCEEAAVSLYKQADKRSFGGKADVEPFVPQLLKAAKSPSGDVRFFALGVLGTVGSKDPAVLPALIEALKDADETTVRGAVEGLRQYGPEAHPAAAALAELLRTKGPPEGTSGGSLQESAAQVLAIMGPKAAKDGLPILLAMLRDKKAKDLRFRGEVAIALGAIGQGAQESVPLLSDELKSLDKDPDQEAGLYCECLLQALLEMGDDGARVVLDFTNPKNEHTFGMALRRLRFNPPAARAAVQGLSVLVKRGTSRQACAAALALAEIGPDAKQSVPQLRDALKTKDEALRVRATQALARIAPDAPTLVPILVESLRNVPTEVKSPGYPPTFVAGSAWALGEIGPDAAPAVPVLLDRLKLTTPRIAPNSPGSDRLQDYKLAMQSWRPLALDEIREDDRACILLALGRIGPNSKEAIPALLGVLQDADEQPAYRCLAAEALGRNGPAAKVAVSALMRVFKDEENTALLQAYVAEALGNIGAEAKEALPLLKEATTQRSIGVRRAAAKAVKAIRP
jgi:HEAT repeat protein